MNPIAVAFENLIFAVHALHTFSGPESSRFAVEQAAELARREYANALILVIGGKPEWYAK